MKRNVMSYERRSVDAWRDLREANSSLPSTGLIASGVAFALLDHGIEPLLIAIMQGEEVASFSVSVLVGVEPTTEAKRDVEASINNDRQMGVYFAGIDYVIGALVS